MSENKPLKIEDSNVKGYRPLISPYILKTNEPLTDKAKETVERSRREIIDMLRGESEKKLLIVGPCSIHDAEAAKEFANALKDLAERVNDIFTIVMRTYFEKPRSTIGWKGMIYDPHLNGNGDINEGLYIAREVLLYNAEIGLASGTEFLDTVIPQYIGDLISWGAIGARTVESQLHRQLASGLSMPIGFKNGTSGNIEVAVNAVIAARKPDQSFPGLDNYGQTGIVDTCGNQYTHIILRGGDSGANYDSSSIRKAQELLRKKGLEETLMVDCSHGNAMDYNLEEPKKDCKLQRVAFEDVISQISEGNKGIFGLLVEANINEGSQQLPKDLTTLKLEDLQYGISVTDPCIGWKTAEELILWAHDLLADSK